jgi:mono/diheme cytochrome c family protein
MVRSVATGLGLLVLVLVGVVGSVLAQEQGGGRSGWTIPAGASKEPNPIAASPEVVAKGKTLYEKNCQKCHGKEGKGDGPDADPDMPPEDLGDPARAPRNPDGTMYYKIWNGRRSPKMPAFKSEGLTQEDVWTVIHFVKTFRKS